MNHHGSYYIMPGCILESEIEQVENKLYIAMNEHELRKLINKLNHKLSYLKTLKRMRDDNNNTYQFTVHNFHR